MFSGFLNEKRSAAKELVAALQQHYKYVLTVYVQILSKLFILLDPLASLSKKWKQYHLTQRVAILNESK